MYSINVNLRLLKTVYFVVIVVVVVLIVLVTKSRVNYLSQLGTENLA